MKTEKGCGIGAEFPYSHVIEILLIIFFIFSWLIDVYIFKLHISYGIFLIDLFRYIGFVSILIFSMYLLKKSSKVITPKVYNSKLLLSDGIFQFVRHPMYLGIILIYLSFVILNLSLIMLIAWIFIFLILNMMASYEERRLEEIFGQEYLDYQKVVSKWIPTLKFYTKKKKQQLHN